MGTGEKDWRAWILTGRGSSRRAYLARCRRERGWQAWIKMEAYFQAGQRGTWHGVRANGSRWRSIAVCSPVPTTEWSREPAPAFKAACCCCLSVLGVGAVGRGQRGGGIGAR